MNISYETHRNELVQNKALGKSSLLDVSLHRSLFSFPCAGLGEEFADVFRKRYGEIDYEWGIAGASTDFVRFASRFPLVRT